MSKAKKSSDSDGRQLSLFDLIQEQRQKCLQQVPQTGTLNIALQIQEIIDKSIGQCPVSREVIAGKMAELTGQQITRFMLDSWTSSAKQNHRFPAEFIPAFCAAVGNDQLVTFLAGKIGIFTMQDRDVLRAELARKMEIREAANKDIKKIKMFMQEME